MAASFLNSAALPGMRAWTGGTPPRSLLRIGRLERALLRREFRRHLLAYRGYWGDLPDRRVMRLFWNRARHDAHATCRDPGRVLARARPDLARRRGDDIPSTA